MVEKIIKGAITLATPGSPGSPGGGSILIGVHASTLIGFGSQIITAGSGYVGIFHDAVPYFDGCIFDGTNVTPGTGHTGHWHYAANGKIVGAPGSGQLRVVIAGLVYDGAYAGEIARQVFTAGDFAAYGYVGYNVFAKAFMGLGDNMGVYLVNDTDASLTIEQGDPDDGSGPPACQIESYLLTFAGTPSEGS